MLVILFITVMRLDTGLRYFEGPGLVACGNGEIALALGAVVGRRCDGDSVDNAVSRALGEREGEPVHIGGDCPIHVGRDLEDQRAAGSCERLGRR